MMIWLIMNHNVNQGKNLPRNDMQEKTWADGHVSRGLTALARACHTHTLDFVLLSALRDRERY